MADFDSVAIVPPAPMEANVIEDISAIDASPIGENPVTEEHPMGAPSPGETETGSPEPQPGTTL
jgi:hypothetical protein